MSEMEDKAEQYAYKFTGFEHKSDTPSMRDEADYLDWRSIKDAFLAGAKAADDDLKTELREANEIIISCKAEIEKLKAENERLGKLLFESEQTGNFLPNDRAEERGVKEGIILTWKYISGIHPKQCDCKECEEIFTAHLMSLWQESRKPETKTDKGKK